MITPYYRDLSRYKNQVYVSPELFKDVYNVGWLSPEHSFPTGEVNPTLLSKIRSFLLMRGGANILFSRGVHNCPLCKKTIYISRVDVSDMLVGISEIWIPFNGKVYASPDMLFHFISEHSYKPPQIFEKAVLAFDVESDWESQEFFDSLLKQDKE